jgi:hypothetical protein
MPPAPLEPPPGKNARRPDREMWRKLAEGRARVIFMSSGKFDELRAAYAMSDADFVADARCKNHHRHGRIADG